MDGHNSSLKRGSGSWVNVAMAVTFLGVIFLGFVTYHNTSKLDETGQALITSYRVRETVEATMSSLKDAETGQRGFIITGQEQYLAPYYVGVNKVDDQMARLRRLTADNSEHQQHLDRLEKLVKQRLALMRETVAIRRRTPEEVGFAEAKSVVLTQRGSQIMDELRQLVEDMLHDEDVVLETRQADSASRAAVTHNSIVAGHLLVLGLLVISGAIAYVDRRKRGEAELRMRSVQAKLEAIVDTALDAVISVDEDQCVTRMNPAAEELFQCEAASAIGQPLEQFIPERFREAHRRHIRDFARSPYSRRRVASMAVGRRADGSEFPLEASIAQTIVDGRKLFIAIVKDVSEREASRLRIRELDAMLDQVRDAIHVRDLEDRIVDWNRGAERLYGWTADEAVGKDANDLLSPACEEEAAAARRSLVEMGEWSGELEHIARDGRQLVVEHRRTLIHGKDGKPTSQLVIEIDVTDRRKVELQERRSQRLESIGTLVGGIAHDLNNVLTPILMGVKLLSHDRPEINRQGLIETIQASTERGAAMIRQLLAFAGGGDGRRETLRFRDTIDDVKRILDHTLPKTIEMHVEIADDLWPVSGDATELSQVLMNLCINARDAMPDGGKLTITAENVVLSGNRTHGTPTLPLGPYLRVAVIDTGDGIPGNIMDMVFDPFFTTKEQGKGTGLGLSTSLGIVRGHGGDMTVYSEVGHGTQFTLYLPAEQSAAASAVREHPLELPRGNRERVLLVDDETAILEMARTMLETYGFRVLAANSGSEALALLERHRDDLRVAVVDMMMPEMDGRATIQAMRLVSPELRVIASSGLRRPDAHGEIVCGARGFLAKPYHDEQMVRVLRQVLDEP